MYRFCFSRKLVQQMSHFSLKKHRYSFSENVSQFQSHVDFYLKDSVKYLILNSTSNRNNNQGVKDNIIKINTAYLKGPKVQETYVHLSFQ